jgi:hypothetical protein
MESSQVTWFMEIRTEYPQPTKERERETGQWAPLEHGSAVCTAVPSLNARYRGKEQRSTQLSLVCFPSTIIFQLARNYWKRVHHYLEEKVGNASSLSYKKGQETQSYKVSEQNM